MPATVVSGAHAFRFARLAAITLIASCAGASISVPCRAQDIWNKETVESPEKSANCRLAHCITMALRTGCAEHLDPVVGTADDYLAHLKAVGGASSGQLVEDEARKKAASWAKEQRTLAAEQLRGVRAFGARLGVDWPNAEIGHVQGSVVFEARRGRQAISVVIDTMSTAGRGVWLSGRSWLATLLSPEELGRLRRWRPGLKREEDSTMGQILVRRSAHESVLSRFGLYDSDQFHNAEVKSTRVTVQLPPSLDASREDSVRVYDEVMGMDGTLREVGNDTLEFRGQVTYSHMGIGTIPMAIVLRHRDIIKQDSWSATVDGRLQTFSRIKESERKFYSPNIVLRRLGSQERGGQITLTLKDSVVVDFRLGSDGR